MTSYVITGLTNDVATGVFVRSFVGGSYSERSEHSSKWVRIKGDNTTPTAGGPPQQQQAAPKTYSVTPTATAAESWSALLTVTLSEAAPAGGVQFTVTAGYSGSADSADVGAIASPVTVPEGSDTLQIAVLTVDDAVDEDDETFTVTVAAVTQGWDPAAGGDDTATVTITDDDTAGVTVTPTSLSVAEDGSATYSVVLDSQPTDDVFVLPLSNDDGATHDSLPLVFSPENWYTPQTITVSGADDADANDESVGITHEASSGDPRYHRVPVSSVSVTVTDDDSPAQEEQQQQQSATDENAIWSATLTVHSSNHGRGCIDVGAGRCSGGVGLTDDDFSFEGSTYTVAKLFYGVNALNLYLDAPITEALKTLTLHVGDAQFPLSSALIPSNKLQRANWPTADPGWSAGDTVQVKLTRTAPAEPPAQEEEEQQQQQQQTPAESEPPTPGQLEPYNIQITPGDGTLTVTWTVAPRDGFDDDQIRHALRWSQEPGVWANPLDPNAGGREDGIAVEGGVYTYTITGLQNGVATGVFIRSFTGGSYSERSEHSSQWVRIKGDETTPQEGL